MPQVQRNASSNGKKTHAFKPIENYDVNTMEPDAQAGEYEAVVSRITIKATRVDQFPMLVINWKLEKAVDDENEKSVGAEVSDFLTFFPEGDRRGRMGKLRLRQLCENLGIDLDVLPRSIHHEDDFNDFIAALKGQTMPVWVTHRTNPETNEVMTGIAYTAPRGVGAPLPSTDEEDEKPAKKSAKPARRR